MGLTIYYKLSVAKNHSAEVVQELVQRAALYARKIGCAEVSEPLWPFQAPVASQLFVRSGKEEDGCFGHVPAREGWLVEVWPGEGCESAHFGLCQYPRKAPFVLRGERGWVATEYRRGWLLKGACKTQYASEHGWEHFLKCHKQIISLLDFWRQLGVTVKVSDEGEYWETRSVEKLKDRLRQYDGLVAAVGGMFKDAAADCENGLSVESPIFDYAHFERLEHEGRLEFGKQVEQLQKKVHRKVF